MELGHLGVLMSYPVGLFPRCLCFIFFLQSFDTLNSVNVMNPFVFWLTLMYDLVSAV
jgi:hypothetical protein